MNTDDKAGNSATSLHIDDALTNDDVQDGLQIGEYQNPLPGLDLPCMDCSTLMPGNRLVECDECGYYVCRACRATLKLCTECYNDNLDEGDDDDE